MQKVWRIRGQPQSMLALERFSHWGEQNAAWPHVSVLLLERLGELIVLDV